MSFFLSPIRAVVGTSPDEKSSSSCVEGKAQAVVLKASTARKTKTGKIKGRLFKNLPADGTTFNSSGIPQRVAIRPKLPIHRIEQTIRSSAWHVSSTTVTTYGNWNVQASQIDQATTLASVFDQYRIVVVEAWIIPRNDTVIGNTANTGLYASVVDLDDANNLASFEEAEDYTNAVVTAGTVGHYRKWAPHCAVAAYSGAFTSYANVASPWIDAASLNVQHYGLKSAWLATDSVYTRDLVIRVHTEWRQVR